MLIGEMHWGAARRLAGWGVAGAIVLIVLATGAARAANPAVIGNNAARPPEGSPAIRWVQATTPAGDPAIGVQWSGARYESLTAFIEALQAERYTSLVFKRVSADLRRGDTLAMSLLLERFYKGRWRRNLPGDASVGTLRLLRSVADDTRAAIAFANKSTDLAIPEFMAEPVVALAQRLVRKIYRLPGDAPGVADTVPVPENTVGEEQSEPRARAENTGLYRDVVDIVKQEHLQFLLGGDALTVTARLLVEVLKIAQSDNLVVDDISVIAFVDRLVEAGVVGPEQRDRLADRAMTAFDLKPDAPKSDLTQIPDPPQTELTTSTDTADVPLPDDQRPAPVEPPAPPRVVFDTGGMSQGGDPLPDATQPATAAPPARAVPAPAMPPVAKDDLLLVVETGLGITLPARKGDLDPLGQSIEFDPGIAARFGLGATWLDALGPAHLGLSLVGVIGQTKADRLNGVAGPGALNIRGSNSYIGVMPFVSMELPVSSNINIRFGGGLGVAYQSLEVLSGGAKLVDADGFSFMAQVGGGLRFALAPCVDWGLDVFATHLDSVKGTGIGAAPVKFAGAWDVAAYATVRVGFGAPAQNPGCHLFAP